jgi:RHS repeat-associated protein
VSGLSGTGPFTQTKPWRTWATFVWGNDISGTRDGAGGVGGLLAMHCYSPNNGTYQATLYPTYDGNGNVTSLVLGEVISSVSTAMMPGIPGTPYSQVGQVVARYDYGPFGEVLTASSIIQIDGVPIAEFNPFRFSTKFHDDDTGLVYYGYRYYSPELGRWLNRDPIGENGGVNLYAMVGNNAVGRWDKLGLICGISMRRFNQLGSTWDNLTAHQFIHASPTADNGGATGNVGFYPDPGNPGYGTWRDEDAVSDGTPGRPSPDDPRYVDQYETELDKDGALPSGKPCSQATCKDIAECIAKQTGKKFGDEKFSPLTNNCRDNSKKALGNCCLKVGKKSYSATGGGRPSGGGSSNK